MPKKFVGLMNEILLEGKKKKILRVEKDLGKLPKRSDFPYYLKDALKRVKKISVQDENDKVILKVELSGSSIFISSKYTDNIMRSVTDNEAATIFYYNTFDAHMNPESVVRYAKDNNGYVDFNKDTAETGYFDKGGPEYDDEEDAMVYKVKRSKQSPKSKKAKSKKKSKPNQKEIDDKRKKQMIKRSFR